MLEKEYEYFLSVRNRLINEHRGEYVVIKDKDVVGFFSSENDAIEAMNDHELGTFLIQHCIPEEESLQKFHSRALFA